MKQKTKTSPTELAVAVAHPWLAHRNKHGFGVTLDESKPGRSKKYKVRVRHKTRILNVGWFDNAHEARLAYDQAITGLGLLDRKTNYAAGSHSLNDPAVAFRIKQFMAQSPCNETESAQGSKHTTSQQVSTAADPLSISESSLIKAAAEPSPFAAAAGTAIDNSDVVIDEVDTAPSARAQRKLKAFRRSISTRTRRSSRATSAATAAVSKHVQQLAGEAPAAAAAPPSPAAVASCPASRASSACEDGSTKQLQPASAATPADVRSPTMCSSSSNTAVQASPAAEHDRANSTTPAEVHVALEHQHSDNMSCNSNKSSCRITRVDAAAVCMSGMTAAEQNSSSSSTRSATGSTPAAAASNTAVEDPGNDHEMDDIDDDLIEQLLSMMPDNSTHAKAVPQLTLEDLGWLDHEQQQQLRPQALLTDAPLPMGADLGLRNCDGFHAAATAGWQAPSPAAAAAAAMSLSLVDARCCIPLPPPAPLSAGMHRSCSLPVRSTSSSSSFVSSGNFAQPPPRRPAARCSSLSSAGFSSHATGYALYPGAVAAPSKVCWDADSRTAQEAAAAAAAGGGAGLTRFTSLPLQGHNCEVAAPAVRPQQQQQQQRHRDVWDSFASAPPAAVSVTTGSSHCCCWYCCQTRSSQCYAPTTAVTSIGYHHMNTCHSNSSSGTVHSDHLHHHRHHHHHQQQQHAYEQAAMMNECAAYAPVVSNAAGAPSNLPHTVPNRSSQYIQQRQQVPGRAFGPAEVDMVLQLLQQDRQQMAQEQMQYYQQPYRPDVMM